MGIELTPRQQAAVTARGGPLLVAAAAGAGKTRVLTERLMDAVSTGRAHIDDHLVVTYTRAAAGELRRRIGEALSRRGASRELFRLNRAQIGTIHAFCAALIRRFAVESGVRPDFRQLDEGEAGELLAQAMAEALETLYGGSPAGSPFDRLAASLSDTGRDFQLAGAVADFYEKLRAMPEPESWMDAQLEDLRQAARQQPEKTKWGRYLLESARAELAFLRGIHETARRGMADTEAAAYGPAFEGDLDNLDRLILACGAGWDALSDALGAVAHPRRKPVRDKSVQASRLDDTRDRYKKALSGLAVRFSPSSEEMRAEAAAALPLAEGLFTAARELGAAYTRLKARRGALDFSDLEHIARRLLTEGEGGIDPAEAGVREVLVDEYQDVNQVQEDIIAALAGSGPCFLVGDARQSIYGFRQADPEIFRRKYDGWPEIERAEEQENGRPACVVLPHNFRSRPMLLNAVNQVFEAVMSREAAGMAYGAREMLRAADGDAAADKDTEPRAELWLHQPDEAGRYGEPDMVAGLIARLGTTPDTRWRDIAILTRTHGELERYRRALAKRGIPRAAREGRLFDTVAAQAALACVQVLDNPRQDMPLLALLRSPLYGCTPDELAAMRLCAAGNGGGAADDGDSGGGDFYDALLAAAQNGHEKAGRLCADLAYLRALAADATVTQVWHAMLARPGLSRIGPPRIWLSLAPVAAKCASVSAFCDALTRMAHSGAPLPSLPGGEDGDGGVTLLTMHQSKGLEFPVVVVAGLSKGFNRDDLRKPVLFHRELGAGFRLTDEQTRVRYTTAAREAVALRLARDAAAEEMRLLYVALTRARDRLFVTASSKDWARDAEKFSHEGMPFPSPYQVMNAARVSDWLLMALAGQLTVNNEQLTTAWKVKLVTGDGESGYEHERKHEHQQEQEQKQPAPGPRETPERRQTGEPPDFPPLSGLPSKLTVTELKGRARDAELSEDAERPYTPPGREFPKPRFMEGQTAMTAAERGTALHAAMQLVEFSRCGTADGVRAELARLARERRMTGAQVGAVDPARVSAFVNSALGRAAAASPDCRRELPFSLLTRARDLPLEGAGDEKVLLQGMIDLLFWDEAEAGWTLVDFKTGRLRGRRPRGAALDYAVQMDAYAGAVARMSGRPVTRRVIWFTEKDIGVTL